jgi:hypothetical protein
MNQIEIMEVGCSLVDGSYLPFYETPEVDEDDFLNPITEFLSTLDLSKIGKINIQESTEYLIQDLLGTDDFGPPPRSLAIRFKMNSNIYQISIPFSNSNIIHFDEYDF